MPTYIRDLIDLPEKVHGGDFVLKLTEGVEHPEATLRPYVVTPQLADCFDRALDFIKGAVQSASSKPAYLHGSFGAGKSHFMPVPRRRGAPPDDGRRAISRRGSAAASSRPRLRSRARSRPRPSAWRWRCAWRVGSPASVRRARLPWGPSRRGRTRHGRRGRSGEDRSIP